MNNNKYLEIFEYLKQLHSKHSSINYKNIAGITYSGIYAISLNSPQSFERFATLPEHKDIYYHINKYPLVKNIIYIGETSDTISQRLYKDELGGCYLNGKEKKSHRATFYRKLGSVLGFKSYNPINKELSESQKRNFVFSLNDNKKIRFWIEENLRVSFFKVFDNISLIQNLLIKNMRPTFNGTHNKSKCEAIANLHKNNKIRIR